MINTYDMLLRLLVAALLGSIIGWERERRQWTAGLRTHMMVGLGSALVMLVSTYGFNILLIFPKQFHTPFVYQLKFIQYDYQRRYNRDKETRRHPN